MGKIIAITSSKGGAGKTLLTAALGMTLAEMGKKVCLTDACFGLRGLDIALGMQDKVVFDLMDLCGEVCDMEQALVKLDRGEAYLIAAPQLIPDPLDEKSLSRGLNRLRKRFDYVLTDTPAALMPGAAQVLSRADEILLLTVPGDEAARNAERVSALIRDMTSAPVSLIMNFFSKRLVASGRVPPPDAISAYLDIPLAGIVPACEAIHCAAFEGRPLAAYPDKLRAAVRDIALTLCGQAVQLKTYHARRLPWHS